MCLKQIELRAQDMITTVLSIVNIIRLTYVTTYSPLAVRFGMSSKPLKLGSDLLVHFIIGWPRNIWQLIMEIYRVIECFENVQWLSKIMRQKTMLPSSSQILACEWWQLNWYLILVCESRLSTQTLDVSAHPTSRNFLHSHTQNYLLTHLTFWHVQVGY